MINFVEIKGRWWWEARTESGAILVICHGSYKSKQVAEDNLYLAAAELTSWVTTQESLREEHGRT